MSFRRKLAVRTEGEYQIQGQGVCFCKMPKTVYFPLAFAIFWKISMLFASCFRNQEACCPFHPNTAVVFNVVVRMLHSIATFMSGEPNFWSTFFWFPSELESHHQKQHLPETRCWCPCRWSARGIWMVPSAIWIAVWVGVLKGRLTAGP